MILLEIFFLSFVLGLDAFSVSIAAGAFFRKATKRQKFRLSFHFGFFQFIMPIIGWAIGVNVLKFIEKFDHWVVFGILFALGLKMIWEGRKVGNEIVSKDISKGFYLITLAIATSLDALAIGFSLALLNVHIFFVSLIIGIVAAAMTLIGIRIGERTSAMFNTKAFIFGGIILILLGIKILFEHLL